MLSPRRLLPDDLRRLAAGLESEPLNYRPGLLDRIDSEPSLSADPRRGWIVDRFETVISHGPADLDAARAALAGWQQFDPGWTVMMHPPAPIEPDAVVTYAARVLGAWWSYGCRILTTIDEPHRFGLVYGTLAGHAECGEERFEVELSSDGDVRFALLAMSRPGRWFAWPGLPVARRAQARFRRSAGPSMRRAVDRARPVARS